MKDDIPQKIRQIVEEGGEEVNPPKKICLKDLTFSPENVYIFYGFYGRKPLLLIQGWLFYPEKQKGDFFGHNILFFS